jgi:hypothetical protein
MGKTYFVYKYFIYIYTKKNAKDPLLY